MHFLPIEYDNTFRLCTVYLAVYYQEGAEQGGLLWGILYMGASGTLQSYRFENEKCKLKWGKRSIKELTSRLLFLFQINQINKGNLTSEDDFRKMQELGKKISDERSVSPFRSERPFDDRTFALDVLAGHFSDVDGEKSTELEKFVLDIATTVNDHRLEGTLKVQAFRFDD